MLVDGDHLPQAAQTVLNEIDLLSSSPTNARNFLVLGSWLALPAFDKHLCT